MELVLMIRRQYESTHDRLRLEDDEVFRAPTTPSTDTTSLSHVVMSEVNSQPKKSPKIERSKSSKNSIKKFKRNPFKTDSRAGSFKRKVFDEEQKQNFKITEIIKAEEDQEEQNYDTGYNLDDIQENDEDTEDDCLEAENVANLLCDNHVGDNEGGEDENGGGNGISDDDGSCDGSDGDEGNDEGLNLIYT